MTPMTLTEVAAAVGGRLDGTDGSPTVTAAGLDSRGVTVGELFVAFRGERVDGHDHAAAAVAAGAAGVLAERPVGVPAVIVDHVTAALGRLARAQLQRLPDLQVVGVTGSSGKTTTKDLLAVLLGDLGPTVSAQGSFNNDIGLPLTVLRCVETTRHLVLEYGARGRGHITRLTEVAPPQVGVVLNVGTAHLGEFGRVEVTAAAKAELVARTPVAVLNADDALVREMASPGRRVLFGEGPGADVLATDVRLDAGGRASFTLSAGGRDAPVSLRLVGAHLVSDALAAAAVALHLGQPLPRVALLLSAAEPASRWRMEVTERADGVTVVNDAYNANPDSARAALQALVSMGRPTGRRTWAVLGEMLELGEAAGDQHDGLGRLAVRLDVSRIVSVGDPAGPVGRLHAGATLEGSWGEEAVHVPDVDAALALLRAELRPGDIVLVKGSRAAGLERVAEGLLA